MNTIKTIVVVATLLGVGYGAHVVLNNPIPNRFSTAEGVWQDLEPGTPQVDFSAMNDARPQITLPDLKPTPLDTIRSSTNSVAAGGTARVMLPVSPGNSLGSQPATGETQTTSLANFRRQASSTVNELATADRVRATDQTVPGMPAIQQIPAHAGSPLEPRQVAPRQSVRAIASVPPTGYVAEGVLTSATDAPRLARASSAVPAVAPTSNAFEETWTSVQSKLDAGQYVDALLLLSTYYRDVNISASQRERMVSMLDQIAGTAIYSSDYHIQAPHTVQAGESLATIAAQYGLSPGFLSRVNGIPLTSPLQSGTQLKIVQGPFRAELSFSDREITLFIGQYYAGRFNCAIGRDLPAQIRSLDVVRIEGAKPYVDFRTGEQIPANDPKNPYGDRWIELSANSLPGTAGLGIHSYGSAVDASDTRGCISVSPEEANDLALILSPGSRITILP